MRSPSPNQQGSHRMLLGTELKGRTKPRPALQSGHLYPLTHAELLWNELQFCHMGKAKVSFSFRDYSQFGFWLCHLLAGLSNESLCIKC